jgi:hypothetical protein
MIIGVGAVIASDPRRPSPVAPTSVRITRPLDIRATRAGDTRVIR